MSLKRWLSGLCLLTSCAGRPELPAPRQPLALTEDTPERAKPPALALTSTPARSSEPGVEVATLANGLTLWVANRPRLAAVALTFAARGASDACGPEIASLTVRAVARGGTRWLDNRVVEPPAINGRRIGFAIRQAEPRLTLDTVDTSLETGLTVLARTVRFPAFASQGFERERFAEVKDLERRSATRLMLRVAADATFGRASGTRLFALDAAAVRDATVDQVNRCYLAMFQPGSSAVILVGNTTLAQALPLVEARFADWKGHPTPRTEVKPWSLLSSGRRIHLLTQGRQRQSSLLVLQPGPRLDSEADAAPFQVLAEIAAGSFRSRANVQLRHDAGVTYGVQAYQLRTREVGLFGIEGHIDATEVGSSLRALLAMLEELRTTPVTADELTLAKNTVVAQFERETASINTLAGSLADVFSDGRPATSLQDFPNQVGHVTAADVQRVAAAYLRPDDAEIVVTGGEALRKELAFLGQVQPYSAEFADSD